MSGFDDPGLFYSDVIGSDQQPEDNRINYVTVKRKFRDFIREFHEGNFIYRYRDQLKQRYNLGDYWLKIGIDDLASFDEDLADKLMKLPSEHLPLLEEAAKEVADEITRPRPEGEETVEDIQVTLKSDANSLPLRHVKSEMVSKLVKMSGIVIAASGTRAKATKIAIQCRTCRNVISNISVQPGLQGYSLPRKCNTEMAGRPKCPLDPYFIMPDKCVCVDFQVLKLQECPEDVPHGEMPRHMKLYCDRYLCEKAVPGNRVVVTGVYSIVKSAAGRKRGDREKTVGIRNPYVRVVGIEVDSEGAGRTGLSSISREEKAEFKTFSKNRNIYEQIASSIAPSIYGCLDIKKALTCMLFGGSRKRLPDGLTRRGDINILLLGDPGTAKSQLLKFIERVAPIGVYTSGKGSSAAGLTASVIRDPSSRNFVMEGGAMVLADGGVVCIDEFDKMREDDRVAIHEAMEQQTISIAKAGITTTLNSRCSVLAAANSVFGRWDDTKGEENIDFMPTILSRFDMIFIVKDEHNESRDMTMAKHVMSVHMSAFQPLQSQNIENEGELSLNFLKKYIAFCRSRCGPRLSQNAGEKLKNQYILMRNGVRQIEQETSKRISIPITVRQLEAVIRISESRAKMELRPSVTDEHVEEALRLFNVSTVAAANTGSLSGAEGFNTKEDHDTINRIEQQIKRRFALGTQVSEFSVVQDFAKQKYPEHAVQKVIYLMIRRGELQYRMQRKMLYRIK
ncbi:minichromosome maintenance protein 5 [Chamberlinius hualienensis]